MTDSGAAPRPQPPEGPWRVVEGVGGIMVQRDEPFNRAGYFERAEALAVRNALNRVHAGAPEMVARKVPESSPVEAAPTDLSTACRHAIRDVRHDLGCDSSKPSAEGCDCTRDERIAAGLAALIGGIADDATGQAAGRAAFREGAQ